jgi:hypothetical protein
MSSRVANLLRIATILVFFAVLALAANRLSRPGDPYTVVEPQRGEFNVANSINRASSDPIVVRGHVFIGPGGLGLRICHGRQNTDPPLCLGPFLDLDGVNEGSFSFESAKADAGTVRWVPEPLALRGTVVGTRMEVSQVLR